MLSTESLIDTFIVSLKKPVYFSNLRDEHTKCKLGTTSIKSQQIPVVNEIHPITDFGGKIIRLNLKGKVLWKIIFFGVTKNKKP